MFSSISSPPPPPPVHGSFPEKLDDSVFPNLGKRDLNTSQDSGFELCSPALLGEEARMKHCSGGGRDPRAGAAWLLALCCPYHQLGAKPPYVGKSTATSLCEAVVICGLSTSSDGCWPSVPS